jgi:hypothetical protein
MRSNFKRHHIMRIFDRFEDIEIELRQYAPPMVYKYRTWTDENHKDLVRRKGVWFSHPFGLNDPLDVRPKAVFNVMELQDPRFLDKLLSSASKMNPHLTNEQELKKAAHEQWLFLNLNPEVVLQNWNNYNLVSANFDKYGVFSTAINPLSDGLWRKYGDNFRGYCIGFDTVELCRNIKSGYGYVNYSDNPFQYSFLENIEKTDLDRLYLKETSWCYEDEFRFITVGIGEYCDRLQGFEDLAVKELILGHNSNEYENEIKEVFNIHFKGRPIYKTVEKGGVISKIQIS